MSDCTCRVCQDYRRWMAAINPQTDEAKAAAGISLRSTDLAGARIAMIRCRGTRKTES